MGQSRVNIYVEQKVPTESIGSFSNFSYINVVKKDDENGLDFLVDKLTNSIENVVTGDSFATDISILTSRDLKTVSKTKGWLFNWKNELK